jgi:hypothetical protein
MEFRSAGVAGLNDVKRVELVEIVAVKWEKSNPRFRLSWSTGRQGR